MKRSNKTLILGLFLAFSGQSDLVAVTPVKPVNTKHAYFSQSLKAAFSKCINTITSYKPSFMQVISGIAAVCGLTYGIHKLYEWFNPSIDPKLLKVPATDSIYRRKPGNTGTAYLLLFGSKSEDAGQTVKGACAQDKKIALECLRDAEVREYFARQPNLREFSRVGTVNTDAIADMSEQERAALKKIKDEAEDKFYELIQYKQKLNASTKDKRTNMPEQILYDLTVAHGKLSGMLEVALFIEKNPVSGDAHELYNKFNLTHQALNSSMEGFERARNLLFKLPLSDKRHESSLPDGWCDPRLTARLQAAMNDYARINATSKNKDHNSYCQLGMRHGYVLGALEMLKLKYTPAE